MKKSDFSIVVTKTSYRVIYRGHVIDGAGNDRWESARKGAAASAARMSNAIAGDKVVNQILQGGGTRGQLLHIQTIDKWQQQSSMQH